MESDTLTIYQPELIYAMYTQQTKLHFRVDRLAQLCSTSRLPFLMFTESPAHWRQTVSIQTEAAFRTSYIPIRTHAEQRTGRHMPRQQPPWPGKRKKTENFWISSFLTFPPRSILFNLGSVTLALPSTTIPPKKNATFHPDPRSAPY